ncbi:MAG: T9SS type A sorting domain-containing protein [Lentimicrobium sp.]
MKKLLFFIAALSVLSAKSQTSVYHPFPDSNASWNIHMSQGMCFMGGWSDEDYSIMIFGDTIIDSQIYHKLTTPWVEVVSTGGCTQQNFSGYQGAIRQDIPGKKVFFVPPSASDEILLYDFNMEVGDTVRGYLQLFHAPTDVVAEIDSVLVGDTYRKRWSINPCYGIYLIEGVGSTFGLLAPYPGCMTDMNDYSLTCFNQDGLSVYPDLFSECLLITSINDADITGHTVHIFPNPSNGSFTVAFDRPDEITEIRISGITGNTVFQKKTENLSTVTITGIPAGTYILTIIDRESRSSNRKIIIRH